MNGLLDTALARPLRTCRRAPRDERSGGTRMLTGCHDHAAPPVTLLVGEPVAMPLPVALIVCATGLAGAPLFNTPLSRFERSGA